ncbi:MAG: hypothetical protein LBK76_03445 [Verrucomicrobiales bacterium]|jgi:hypothetical protein|nr:hypothetical protein [Verrucomicrobiales bacterium]
MDARFYEALVHQPHTVLGARLRPFAVEHWLCLQFQESPFLLAKTTAGWAELEAAVAVCARRRPLRDLWRIGDFRSRHGVFLRNYRPQTLTVEAAKFAAYLADYLAPPLTPVADGGGAADTDTPASPVERPKTPWLLRMVETLKQHGYDERDYAPCFPFRNRFNVWTLPAGEAVWRYAAILENDGQTLNIFDEEEQELMKLLD